MATKKKVVTEDTSSTETTKQESKPQAEPKPARVKDEQNGVSRPSSGATLRVWVIADEISGKEKRPATRAEVTEAGAKEDLVLGTIHTQYGRWRKYNGLVTPKEDRAAAQAAAKAEKEAAKAEAKKAKDAEKAAKADAKAKKEAPAEEAEGEGAAEE